MKFKTLVFSDFAWNFFWYPILIGSFVVLIHSQSWSTLTGKIISAISVKSLCEQMSKSCTSLNFVLDRFRTRSQVIWLKSLFRRFSDSKSSALTLKNLQRRFYTTRKKKLENMTNILWLITCSKIEIRSQCHFKI